MLGLSAIAETPISALPDASSPPSGRAASSSLPTLTTGLTAPVPSGDSQTTGPRSGSTTPPTARAGAAT